jgi:hypothetical protein
MGGHELAVSGSVQELMLGSLQQVNLSSVKVGNSLTVWETEILAFLGSVLVDIMLLTFRDNISLLSSRVKQYKMIAIACKCMNI